MPIEAQLAPTSHESRPESSHMSTCADYLIFLLAASPRQSPTTVGGAIYIWERMLLFIIGTLVITKAVLSEVCEETVEINRSRTKIFLMQPKCKPLSMQLASGSTGISQQRFAGFDCLNPAMSPGAACGRDTLPQGHLKEFRMTPCSRGLRQAIPRSFSMGVESPGSA
jgi:hypothetical protein